LALGEHEELRPGTSEYYRPDQLPTNGAVRVVLGELDGMHGPVPTPPNVTYLQLSLETDQQVTLAPRPEDVAFVAALRGRVEVLGFGRSASIEGPELGVLGRSESPVVVVARSPAQLIYGAAPPHPHELVPGKHSVHTSRSALIRAEAEIARAWSEGLGGSEGR
jgi:redox-sensitive bicupin YhaK (pirin superfamily)